MATMIISGSKVCAQRPGRGMKDCLIKAYDGGGMTGGRNQGETRVGERRREGEKAGKDR